MIIIWGMALKLLRGRKKDRRRFQWARNKSNRRYENRRRRQRRNY